MLLKLLVIRQIQYLNLVRLKKRDMKPETNSDTLMTLHLFKGIFVSLFIEVFFIISSTKSRVN